jgi:hypothetical protein
MRRRGGDRTRTGSGVEPDQNKSRQVPQRPFISLDLLTLQRTTMDGLRLARAPTDS